MDILPGNLFRVCISNFEKTTQTLHKVMVVTYDVRSPLSIIAVDGDASRHHECFLNIPKRDQPGDSVIAAQMSFTPTPTPALPPELYWRDMVDLSSIPTESKRKRTLRILADHSAIWSWQLGSIHATEHRIDLQPATNPVQ